MNAQDRHVGAVALAAKTHLVGEQRPSAAMRFIKGGRRWRRPCRRRNGQARRPCRGSLGVFRGGHVLVGVGAGGDGAQEEVAARFGERAIADRSEASFAGWRHDHEARWAGEEDVELALRELKELVDGAALAVGQLECDDLVDLGGGVVAQRQRRAGGDPVGEVCEGVVDGTDLDRLLYTISCLHRMTVSLARDGVWPRRDVGPRPRPATVPRRGLLRSAGPRPRPRPQNAYYVCLPVVHTRGHRPPLRPSSIGTWRSSPSRRPWTACGRTHAGCPVAGAGADRAAAPHPCEPHAELCRAGVPGPECGAAGQGRVDQCYAGTRRGRCPLARLGSRSVP